MQKNWLDMLDEVRAIAQTGINYARSPYDLSQYTRILELASQQYEHFSGLSSEVIRERFAKELGYITPKIGVQCALFDNEGRMLLEHRADDKLWGLPGGWVDMVESPEMTVEREMREETSLVVQVGKVVGFYTRLPGQWQQPHTTVHITYLCHYVSGEIHISHESLDMAYRHVTEITDWHKDHHQMAVDAKKIWEAKGAEQNQ